MGYKIEGTTEEPGQLLVIDETNYSIEVSTNISAGDYEVTGLTNTSKTLLLRSNSNGESKGFSGVNPVFYQDTFNGTYRCMGSTLGNEGYVAITGATWFVIDNTLWRLGTDGNRTYDIWIRISNVTIPQGATINNAYLTIYWSNDSGGNTIATMRAENSDNAGIPVDRNDYLNGPWINHGINWNIPSKSSSQFDTSPNIASLLQTVVNRTGWSSGNNVLFSLSNNGSTGPRYARATSDTGDGHTLYVEYSI